MKGLRPPRNAGPPWGRGPSTPRPRALTRPCGGTAPRSPTTCGAHCGPPARPPHNGSGAAGRGPGPQGPHPSPPPPLGAPGEAAGCACGGCGPRPSGSPGVGAAGCPAAALPLSGCRQGCPWARPGLPPRASALTLPGLFYLAGLTVLVRCGTMSVAGCAAPFGGPGFSRSVVQYETPTRFRVGVFVCSGPLRPCRK